MAAAGLEAAVVGSAAAAAAAHLRTPLRCHKPAGETSPAQRQQMLEGRMLSQNHIDFAPWAAQRQQKRKRIHCWRHRRLLQIARRLRKASAIQKRNCTCSRQLSPVAAVNAAADSAMPLHSSMGPPAVWHCTSGLRSS